MLDDEVRVHGLPVNEDAIPFRRQVAALFDEDALFPSLSLREHLQLVARGHSVPDPDAAVDAELDFFALQERADAVPASVSSGQRRRLLGAVSGHTGAAVFLMDLNEMGRALSTEPDGVASARAARWYARGGRTPFGAPLRADTAAFLRTRGLWVRPVLVLLLCAALLLTAGAQPPLVQLGMIAVAVLAEVPALGAVARRTAIMPGLDLLLPLSVSVVKLSRMALPAAALAPWTAVLCTVLVLLGAGDPSLIALGTLAGVGFGASAVRGAYRVQPDWTIPPKETPFGPMPSAQTGALIRGLDTTLLALVPLLLGLFLGYVPGVLLLAQAEFSAISILVVICSRPI